MARDDDFAFLMESVASDSSKRAARRLRRGEVTEGTIVQITSDSVFVDVGGTSEARIDRAEVLDRSGELTVKVGDRVRATVTDGRPGQLTLALAIGRDGAVDVGALEAARAAGATVEGVVTQAIKGGLEIGIGELRAFCPASQVDVGYVADLGTFVGQTVQVRVVEVRDGGRSVVVSRRAEVEARRQDQQRAILERLAPGAEVEGTVHSTNRHGAVIDLGGIEGFVHISELAHHRIGTAEDAVSVGDAVRARVLAVEESPKGVRVRLSIKALLDAPPRPAAPAPDEVLKGVISRHSTFGVFVETPSGEGLVPARDLGLPPGADHKRAYPIGREVEVVVVQRDAQNGKLRFSVSGVADVQERRNFREFAAVERPATRSGGMGSLGDLLRAKLDLPAPAVEPAAPVGPARSPDADGGVSPAPAGRSGVERRRKRS
ncbi:MAG: S1 RNA-binding domain-containing protein [Polyangiaceae bacterium]|nr:S1 RNA-binding domain-containing protein [Polyangiaceae bacterium]